MTTRKRPIRAKETYRQRFQRYSLVGAALGLYFGLFFRPTREPDPIVVLSLAAAATLVMTLLKLRQVKQPATLARYAARTFVLVALALAMLDGRHYAYELGGRVAVTVMTTTLGAITGALMARFGVW